MKPAELAAQKARVDPPWDDLRERRVLAGVLEKRRAGPLRPRRLVQVSAAFAAVVVVAAIALFVARAHRMNAVASAVAVAPAPAASTPSTIALADGSQAVVLREASVQVEEQRPDRVHIVQTRGNVRYEVRPDPAREFTVRAAGALIRVRGTVFSVDVSDGGVEVAVQRGHVQVDDRARTRDLVAGESLRIQAPSDADASTTTEPWPTPSATGSGDTAGDSSGGTGSVASASALEAEADAARLAGHNGRAASALERLVALHPRDARVPAALFTLGRVERARDRPAASARAFERCYGVAPGGPLAEDALAEAAVSWSSAGADDSARADAKKYLRRWPDGPNSTRMQAIALP